MRLEPGKTQGGRKMTDLVKPKAVVSNTGPIISALQSGRIDILRQFYDCIHVPASTLAEFEQHGAGQEIQTFIETGFIVVHDDLTAAEKQAAWTIAQEIGNSPLSKDKEAAHHYPEAEAIVLMNRAEL